MRTTGSFLALCVLALSGCFDPPDDESTGADTNASASNDEGDTESSDAGDGDGDAEIYGCTPATAMDMTGSDTVNVTDISAWAFGHTACVRVSAGTIVQWSGDLTAHPLAGGADLTVDATSPITLAADGATGTTVEVTLEAADDYPYFCTLHGIGMTGVIYVE